MNELEENYVVKHYSKHNSCLYYIGPIVVCGDCLLPIEDFFDDCGYFYSGNKHGDYVAKCRECNGPLTGDR